MSKIKFFEIIILAILFCMCRSAYANASEGQTVVDSQGIQTTENSSETTKGQKTISSKKMVFIMKMGIRNIT